MITLKDMQENNSPLGIKEIVELIDINPDITNDKLNALIMIQYGVTVEEICLQLARVKF